MKTKKHDKQSKAPETVVAATGSWKSLSLAVVGSREILPEPMFATDPLTETCDGPILLLQTSHILSLVLTRLQVGAL